MKRIILTAFALVGIYAAEAQQTIVSMRTGYYDTYNPNGPQIPVALYDDTWMVKIPGAGTYQQAFTTTGREPFYMNTNQTLQDISPALRVIAPAIYTVNTPSVPAIPGDIYGVPSGLYTYRMQFQYDKCNSINSAQIDIDIMTGDGITGLMINGHYYSLPVYSSPPAFPYLDCDFLVFGPAYYAKATVGNPYFTSYIGNGITIPHKIITVQPGDIINGTNSIYIFMMPSPINTFGPNTGGLMIDAELTINYTPYVAPNPPLLSVSGSAQSICLGQSATINVGLNAPNPSNYGLTIDHNVYSGLAPTSQVVNPTSSTTYAIKLTNYSTGCVNQVNWPINVILPPTTDLMSTGSTEQMCLGTPGFLNLIVNTGSSAGIPCTITDLTTPSNGIIFSGVLYGGQLPVSVNINPTTSTNYKIILTDPNTGCSSSTFWFVSVLAPPCDGFKNLNTTGINKIENQSDLFKISPNPSHGLYTLKQTGLANGTISIYNISGHLVKKMVINKESLEYSIDLTEFSNGIYLFNLDSNDKHFSKKIIKE